MRPARSPNRNSLEFIARRLSPLLGELVFVGGHVAELLVTDDAAVRVRQTDDVDVVVGVTTRTGYQAFGERLKALGFREDARPDAPICRWRDPDDLALDVMPLDPAILGFSNRWYEAALRDAKLYSLGRDLVIRIPGSPLYLACKWAAFEGRAHGDVIGSHDLEDIITVVAGRRELLEELRFVESGVRDYVASATARLLAHPYAHDVIVGALPDAWDDPTLLADIEARLRTIATVERRL